MLIKDMMLNRVLNLIFKKLRPTATLSTYFLNYLVHVHFFTFHNIFSYCSAVYLQCSKDFFINIACNKSEEKSVKHFRQTQNK